MVGVPFDKKSFTQQKKELRAKYKLLKCGAITEDQLTERERFLLKKYYGLEEQGDD